MRDHILVNHKSDCNFYFFHMCYKQLDGISKKNNPTKNDGPKPAFRVFVTFKYAPGRKWHGVTIEIQDTVTECV